jgi:hypothetical protein
MHVEHGLAKQASKMPKRPRSHQLETASRTAFERSLPKSAIFRTVAPDYGIDGIVEVFDDGEAATGDFFLVQLKSTDQKNLAEALSITLKAHTVRYYDSLILPVFMVLYHASSGQIYANWFKTPEAKGQQSTITVKLSPNDLWTTDRWKDVLSKLRTVRVLHTESKRREAISTYYAVKSAIDLSAKAERRVGNVNHSDLKAGTRGIHPLFGRGVVTDASPYYLFVKFDSDNMDRKFNPGDAGEFMTG